MSSSTTTFTACFVQSFREGRSGCVQQDVLEAVPVNLYTQVMTKSSRMDCGVAGYDNTFGLPLLFPAILCTALSETFPRQLVGL